MPLIIAKLISEDSITELDAAVAAYKGGVGSDLLNYQRSMASFEFKEPDGDYRISMLLAHDGIDVPTATNKTADLQHIVVQKHGSIAELQTAIDLALSEVVHETVTDGDLDNVANEITSASAPFTVAEDVGRKVLMQGEIRTLTAVASTTVATYDGVALTGTSQTVAVLGAEVIQEAHLNMYKSASGEIGMHALLACEGELP